MIKQAELVRLLELRQQKKVVEHELGLLVGKLKEGVDRVQKGRFSLNYDTHWRRNPSWKDAVQELADVLVDKYKAKRYVGYVEGMLDEAPTTLVEKITVTDSETGAVG